MSRLARVSTGGLAVAAQVRRGEFGLSVECEVAAGDVLAVLGPNGSGKSTLLRAVAGLTPVSAGQVVLDGRVLDDARSGVFVDPRERAVGFVFQDYRLFPHLTVRDNVAFGLRSTGVARSAARRHADEWLARLGLVEFSNRTPSALSGGQAQRVALARALAGEPSALLLDEPLAALDALTRMKVQTHLKAHLGEFDGPCLLVTHDPLEALMLADRLLVIEQGVVVQQGTPAEVTSRPATDYIATLVGLNLYSGQATGGEIILDGVSGTHDGDGHGGSRFVVADRSSGEVFVAMRPSAVVVSIHRPAGSARNAWPGTVTGLTLLADRVRLTIDARPPLIADVTPAAVAELGLAPGSAVWASVKATDLEVYARRSDSGQSGV